MNNMLPKTAEYALRAVVRLAQQPGDPASADELAEATQTPRRYLHKVLQDLARAKLLRSQSGPGGGYALNRAPHRITILDVVNAGAPLERIRHCPLGIPGHALLCPLHRELGAVYAAFETSLRRVTIAKLVRSARSTAGLCEVT